VNLELKGKTYIISGSSRGIGQGIAKLLLEEGANTVITGRTKKDVINTFNNFKTLFPDNIIYHVGDLSNPGTIEQLVKKTTDCWGKIDGVVANAGAVKPTPNEVIDDDDWDWYFNCNFNISVRLIQYLIEYLKISNGSVVFISSIAGLEELGAPMPYNTSKAALNVYAKGLASRLAKWKIRVNVVAPGNILFPGGNWDNKLTNDPDGIKKLINEKVPLNKFGTPEDVANIVTYLLSDKAQFITGSLIVVDGGQTTGF